MPGNLYVHKVFPHDITHEVGFTQDVHYMFFNSSYYLSFTKAHSTYIYNVTVNDATDLRFGGDFKSMLPYTLSVGDFICIEKNGTTYKLFVLSRTSETAKRYNMILGVRQRHIIFENGRVIYKR
jgi:hypothetical protein